MKVFALLSLLLILMQGCRLFDENAPSAPKQDYAYTSSVISSPVVGAVLSRGGTMDIQWSGFKVKKVTLELWKKKLYNHQTIVTDLDNGGSYKWRIPEDTPASVSYQVKLISTENPAEYIYSEVFTIK